MSERPAIPWDRIVHFHGRGTDIPAAIAQLSHPAPGIRTQAATNLAKYLEHQDGLTQATPFGVQQLLDALATGAVIEKGPALMILQVVANAAIWHLDRNHAPSLTLADLLAPSRLWPPFESEHQDEILSEEWDPPQEEYHAYHTITAEILVAGTPIIQSLLADDGSVRPVAEPLLSTIDNLSAQLRNKS